MIEVLPWLKLLFLSGFFCPLPLAVKLSLLGFDSRQTRQMFFHLKNPGTFLPVDDEGQRPLDYVVEGKSLQSTEGHIGRFCIDYGLFLFGLDSQHP